MARGPFEWLFGGRQRRKLLDLRGLDGSDPPGDTVGHVRSLGLLDDGGSPSGQGLVRGRRLDVGLGLRLSGGLLNDGLLVCGRRLGTCRRLQAAQPHHR
jgi:hypothetical protein